MDDFIFGTLDTEVQRLERHKGNRLGIYHGGNRNPLDPLPDQPVTLSVWIGSHIYPLGGWIYYTTDGSDPIGERGKALQGQAVELEWASSQWDDLIWGYYHLFQGTLPGQKDQTIVRYRISLLMADGIEIFADNGAYYAYAVDTFAPPEWSKNAIIYHIFVDRFARPKGETWNPVESIEGIFGGNLRGILDRLDYLQNLGVNTLYLSPIFPSSSHHRYDATDYFNIDPMVGDKRDLRQLLDTLHQQGMHLILDFVPNHWSDQHPTFRQAISDPNSPYRDWYIFSNYPNNYECFFNVPCMPKVNLRNPQARAYMIEAAKYWLGFGVDGFRIDHAIGPTPDFWADFRLQTRQVNPECWTIGEIIESPLIQLTYSGLLDGCLDFLLLEAFRQTFATQQWSAQKLASFLMGHYSLFPEGFSLPSFLDNHDMDRFLWAAGGDTRKLKLAALCQFTLPGIPMIYYGTEVGLSQRKGIRDRKRGFGKLEEARLPMLWGDEQDQRLFRYYQQLIQFRRHSGSLCHRNIYIQMATPDLLVFRRPAMDREFLVCLNVSDRSQSLFIEPCWDKILLATEETIPHPTLASNNRRHITLSPYSGVILIQGGELIK